MPAWYDLVGLSSRDNEACDGIDESAAIVRALCERELSEHDISRDRIVVGGFSQGGALALYTSLTWPDTSSSSSSSSSSSKEEANEVEQPEEEEETPLAGILCMSGYMPCQQRVADDNGGGGGASQSLQHTPILLCHGDADPMVRPEWATASYDYLCNKMPWRAPMKQQQQQQQQQQQMNKMKSGVGEHGVSLKWYAGMTHSACEEELSDVHEWLLQRLPM
jgi:predicted esterase